jgi:O-acetyl-ADP-ribose deacetylase (regulator of RNase III)
MPPSRRKTFSSVLQCDPASRQATAVNQNSEHRAVLQQLGELRQRVARLESNQQAPLGRAPLPDTQLSGETLVQVRLDRAYQEFLAAEKQHLADFPPPPPPPPTRDRRKHLSEVTGDVFKDAPPTAALCHCVGADLAMSAGVAADFREIFGNVTFLKEQRRGVGQVAVLPVTQDGFIRYVFYLVTKEVSAGARPRLEDIKASVESMALLCALLGVKQLAMPKIGAGLDKQPWTVVRQIVDAAFENVDTKVTVYLKPKNTSPWRTAGRGSPQRLQSVPTVPSNTPAPLPPSVSSAAWPALPPPLERAPPPNSTTSSEHGALPRPPATNSPKGLLIVEKSPCVAPRQQTPGVTSDATAHSTTQGRQRQVQQSQPLPLIQQQHLPSSVDKIRKVFTFNAPFDSLFAHDLAKKLNVQNSVVDDLIVIDDLCSAAPLYNVPTQNQFSPFSNALSVPQVTGASQTEEEGTRVSNLLGNSMNQPESSFGTTPPGEQGVRGATTTPVAVFGVQTRSQRAGKTISSKNMSQTKRRRKT